MPKPPIYKDKKIEIYSVDENAQELLFMTHGGWTESDKHTNTSADTMMQFYTPHGDYGKNSSVVQILSGTPPRVTSIMGPGNRIWNYGLYEDDRPTAKNVLKDYLEGKPYMKAAHTIDILIVVGDECLMSHLFGLITKKKIKNYSKIHFTACRVIPDGDTGNFKNFDWAHIDQHVKAALDKAK